MRLLTLYASLSGQVFYDSFVEPNSPQAFRMLKSMVRPTSPAAVTAFVLLATDLILVAACAIVTLPALFLIASITVLALSVAAKGMRACK